MDSSTRHNVPDRSPTYSRTDAALASAVATWCYAHGFRADVAQSLVRRVLRVAQEAERAQRSEPGAMADKHDRSSVG